MERLIRSIYRPHNLYCIHIDSKSQTMYETMQKYAPCFENVILIQDRINVTYAHFTRVSADLKCFDALLQRNTKWSYLINLCGEDFPLKTNYQIVKVLKGLFGKQSIESVSLTRGKGKSLRFEKSWIPSHLFNGRPNESKWKEITDWSGTKWYKSLGSYKMQSFPLGNKFPMFAGSAYNIFSRDFINWTVNNLTAQRIIKWSRDTYSPDEFLWATLSRFNEAPDSFPVEDGFDVNDFNSLARIVIWEGKKNHLECSGRWQRQICVLGFNEVGWLLRQKQLFANKFSTNDPDSEVAIQCLERALRKMEQLEACDEEIKLDQLL